ncbi:MAG: hypothetical protein HW386_649 [Gammaproteobacteria bacterium]|nr:hypothetical protein [Gammaproteobacteria bacterium]
MVMENFYQATDGKEAITVIDNKYFDLVVTN